MTSRLCRDFRSESRRLGPTLAQLVGQTGRFFKNHCRRVVQLFDKQMHTSSVKHFSPSGTPSEDQPCGHVLSFGRMRALGQVAARQPNLRIGRQSNNSHRTGCEPYRLPRSLKPSTRFKTKEIRNMHKNHKTDTDRGKGDNHPRWADPLEFRFLFEVLFKA